MQSSEDRLALLQNVGRLKELTSTVKIAPRAQPFGLRRAFRVRRVIQSLGASKVVEVFALSVKSFPWIGRVTEHERLVAGIFPYPRPQSLGQIIIGAANILDAESVLPNTPERIIASGSPCYNFSNFLRV